jgi:transitional endoplasmic reticulum ATPase
LCQRAAKGAIRDCIQAEEDYIRLHSKDGKADDVDMSEMVDTVPTITRKHFEAAWKNARTSVSQQDLYKFD